MRTFNLEIITPEKTAFSDEAEMVIAPTSSGEIGVLAGHVPLFTRLTEGEVRIFSKGREIFLAVGSGFMEINPDKSVILVTSAYKSEELNEREIIEAKRRAEEALAAKPKGEEFFQAQSLFRKSLAELKVLKRKKGTSNIS